MSIKRYCDRCEAEIKRYGHSKNNVRMGVDQRPHYSRDLCDDCVKVFVYWVEDFKKED